MTRPSRLIGAPKRLPSPQIRRSQSAAISRPPPTQIPSISATNGWRQAASALSVPCMVLPYARACSAFERSVSNSAMSLPGLNALPPAPRKTTQRTPSSPSSRATASPSKRHSGFVMALSLSGRFIVKVTMPPSRCSNNSFAIAGLHLPSQPTAALEIKIRQHRRDDHQGQGDGVAEAPIEFRHRLEVHSVDAGDQRRRHERDRGDGEDLDDAVLLDIDHPEQRVELEIDDAGNRGTVLRQRRHVARQALDVIVQSLVVLLFARQGEKAEQPAEADQTVAHLRRTPLILAYQTQQFLKIEPGDPGGAARLAVEYGRRDAVDVASDMLQHVGDAVDDRLEQAAERGRAVGAHRGVSFGMGQKCHKGSRLVVT